MPVCEPRVRSIEDWARLVQAEYEESPGLSLTRGQVRRLWNLDKDTCDAVLDTLITLNVLRRTRGDMFVRFDSIR